MSKGLIYIPEEHQVEAIEFGSRHHYCIIGDDMGLGKSFEATAIMVNDESVDGFTIVCPAHLKYNWKAELLKCQDKYSDKDIIICNDTLDISAAHRRASGKVIILNYELLLRKCIAEKLFKSAKNVIVDEAHYLKNCGATRSMAFHNYIEDFQPDRLLLLTGTAIKNRVHEFYSLFLLCSHNPRETSGQSIIGMHFEHFKNKFMKKRFKRNARGFKTQYEEHYGIKNREKLEELKKDKYIRRTSLEVRGVTASAKFVEMGDKFEDPKMLEEWKAFQKGTKVDTVAKVKSATLIAPHTAKYVLGMMEEVGQVVVFSEHRKPAKMIAEALRKKKFKVGYIDGSVSMIKRQAMVDAFQAGELDAMVGTYLAMGTGYTMTAAWNCITNDWPWVPGDVDQGLRRIDRKTQTKHCVNHHMVGGRVTKYIYRQLIEKTETIKEAL